MHVNMERVLHDYEVVNGYTSTPGNGCTRFSYSHEDEQARNYLISQMEALGLAIKTDAIGNIRATYRGDIDRPSVMIGSHIDTVKNGGQFDGLTGVLAALETIRVIDENHMEPDRPIELIIFAEEEGSNFGITMLGSKVLTGQYSLDELKRIEDQDGQSVVDVAKHFNLAIENMEQDILTSDEVEAMIELHIEQGVVLENEQQSIGIVEAIAGMKTFTVTLEGDSNHAGTTPMDVRYDPLVGASEIIAGIQKQTQAKGYATTVATVGHIACEPNISNVIPEKVEFMVDIRDVRQDGIAIVADELQTLVDQAAEAHSLTSDVQLVGESDSVNLSSTVSDELEATAANMDLDYMRMNSGAVHDAAMLTGVTDVGMIFIPSVEGKSHSPQEFTKAEDIEKGANVLLNTVINLTRSR